MYCSKRKGYSFARREQERKNISNNYMAVSRLRDRIEKKETFLMAAEEALEVVAVIAELLRFQ